MTIEEWREVRLKSFYADTDGAGSIFRKKRLEIDDMFRDSTPKDEIILAVMELLLIHHTEGCPL